MFNKLIVSTNERRSNRTARYFIGTSVFYLITVACAFAVSIIVANPKLADTSARSGIMITPAPSADVGSGKPASSRQPAEVAPRQDSNNVRRLDDILADPAPARSVRQGGPPRPPGLTGIDGGMGDGPGDPNGVEGGLPEGVIVPNDHGNATEPPKPPEPVKPQARAAEAVKPVRLTSVVLQGKATARRTPDYPPLAKQVRLEGFVSVEVMIAPDGRVESARAVSGHPMFIKAAVDSAYGWRFAPTLLNGAPVRVTGIIVFNFKLN